MILAKKSLGQNFLRDKNIIKKIVNLVYIKNSDVIEIGPGDGALTDQILKLKPKNLFLIEKDSNLYKNLKIKYNDKKFIKIYNEDILKFNFKKINKKNTLIFGNLPYNISSQIFVKLLCTRIWPPFYSDLILMFQKELGEKIITRFPSKKFGRLAILFNYTLDLKKKFIVSPNCFKPKPKIYSLVFHAKPKLKRPGDIKILKNLEKVTSIFFSNKRKMINKNIKKILNDDEIRSLKDIKMSMRPTEIKPEIYYKITELFEKK